MSFEKTNKASQYDTAPELPSQNLEMSGTEPMDIPEQYTGLKTESDPDKPENQKEEPARDSWGETRWDRAKRRMKVGGAILATLGVVSGYAYFAGESDRNQAEAREYASEILGSEVSEMTELLLSDGSTVVVESPNLDPNEKAKTWTLDADSIDTTIEYTVIPRGMDLGDQVIVAHKTGNTSYETEFSLDWKKEVDVTDDPRESIENISSALSNPELVLNARTYKNNDINIAIGIQPEIVMKDYQEIIDNYQDTLDVTDANTSLNN